MPSFGEKLKLEREKRAITLEQISLSTKIGTRMLQALEEDKFNQLPGGIFNKGFVRAYARHVGLDEDQAVADYLEASGEGSPPKGGPEGEIVLDPREAREPAPSQPLPWGLIAALLLLAALALLLWSRHQEKRERQPAQSPPPASSTQTPVADHEADSAAVSTASVASGGVNSPATAPAKPDVTPAPIPTATPGKAPIAAAVTPASVPSEGEFTVVILAREDSWLSIVADGKPTVVETLLADDQRAIHARKEVVIKCGNTGALDFVFNGKKLARQGGNGEVKTLTFGSGGLQPNPPAPSVTQ